VKRAYIFVDNLKIGGYQRLSLDQAYALSDLDYIVTMIVLSPRLEWTAAIIEKEQLELKKIELLESKNSRVVLLKLFYKLFPSSQSHNLFISHSLRATFVLRLVNIITRRNLSINTTLHQLPRLSHLTQRIKRFIYAQFTSQLYCFSKAAEIGWYRQFGVKFEGVLSRYTKPIKTLRNGIYLDRLPEKHLMGHDQSKPRIIYLGRLSFWKGLDTIKKLASSEELSEFDFVLMVPAITAQDFQELKTILGERLTVIEGKSVASFQSQSRDVHIYPANYGKEVEFIESISLNCLEMCAIGVPSVVTSGGLVTWPELLETGLVKQVNWLNIGEVANAIKLSQNIALSPVELSKVRALVDINRQIENLLERGSLN
jgi:glycosyltransferase involved in cell wall biosynthesis